MHRIHFGDYYNTFVECKPSAIGLREGKISTENPNVYLAKTVKKTKKRLENNRMIPGVPRHMEYILSMQDGDGYWKWNEAFKENLDGYVPDPMEGISSKKWATAVALVLMQRLPDHFEALRSYYDLGCHCVSHDVLLVVRDCLPPIPCPYRVSKKLVREGKWKFWKDLAEQEVLNDGGEEEDDVVRVVKKKERTEDEEIKMMNKWIRDFEKASSRSEKKKMAHRMKRDCIAAKNMQREVLWKKHDIVKTLWRRKNANEPLEEQEETFHAKIILVHSEISVDIVYLNAQREIECNVSTNVLEKIGHIASAELAEKWTNHIDALDKVERKTSKLRMKPSWNDAKQRIVNAKPKPCTKKRINRRTNRRVAHDFCLPESSPMAHTAYATIVDSIKHLEHALENIHQSVRSCTMTFRNSKLHADKMRAFAPLTSQLRDCVEIIVIVVENIVQWRGFLARKEDTLEKRPAFTWNGQNIVSQLVGIFDFLAQAKYLVKWYGADFSFTRNPFLRAVKLEDRPKTPRCAERTVIINGEETTEISQIILQEREKDIEILQAAEARIQEGPTWWPEAKYPIELKRRIRVAEKELLFEIQHTQLA